MSDPLVAVSDPVWKHTVKRAKVLAQLADLEECSAEQIEAAAKKLKLGRAMVYRLLARFRLSQEATSLLPSKPGRKPGARELEPEQEGIVETLIRRFYLSKQKPPVSALHRTIAIECFQKNLPTPSYQAVRTRLQALGARDVVLAREGAKAAGDRFRPVRGSLRVTQALDLVQIDHTLVDVIVVEECDRKPIGRPWLSLAIDVATRSILGFFLSLKTPSAVAVALTISRAVLPKTSFLDALKVDAPWPAHGIPKLLQLDNAQEFRARAVRRGCEQHGIEIAYRPPLRPHFGGHIERLIGTLMGEVHLLPGTTFRSVAKRGAYDSAGKATMTLAELDAWLAWQIVGVYHHQVHSAIRCTPLAAWERGVERMRKPIKEPSDPKRFYWDFLPFEQRLVTRHGIQLFNILYWQGALGTYVRDGDQHFVRYDPSNLSRVYLLERGGSYLEIPYRDLSHGAVSLREIQMGARRLRALGASPKDEQKLFQAIQKQREIIENSKKKTLKARRQAQQARESNPPSAPPAQPKIEVHSEPDSPVDPFPFEIWHE